MPTIAAHVRSLPAGFATRPRRATDGTVFVVVEGRGRARIEGRDFALAERDSFVVPAWQELMLEAEAGADLVLFGFSDRAAQEKLGLFPRVARASLIRPAAPLATQHRNGPANPRRTGALPRSKQEGPGP